nr:N-acetylglucosamine-6-phosphate deacetylase [Acidobacteriota bacterium]
MKVRGRVGLSGEVVDLLIADRAINAITPANLSQACELGDTKLRLSAGLIDIQINGYGGVDLN